jgi:hypothetical protein
MLGFKSTEAIAKVTFNLKRFAALCAQSQAARFPLRVFSSPLDSCAQALDNGIDYFHTGEDTRLGGLTRNM